MTRLAPVGVAFGEGRSCTHLRAAEEESVVAIIIIGAQFEIEAAPMVVTFEHVDTLPYSALYTASLYLQMCLHAGCSNVATLLYSMCSVTAWSTIALCRFTPQERKEQRLMADSSR